MRRITEFDGVRALAVTMVILDHYAPFRNFAHNASARYGGTGVDVFFVLSGYLITTILLKSKNEEHPYRVFYARRSLRILPAYALVLVLVYAGGALLHEPVNRVTLAGHLLFLRSFKGTGELLSSVLHVIQHPGAIPALFGAMPQSLIPRDYGRLPMAASLGPTWSLSVEEWFYFLWAPIVLLLSRRAISITAFAVCITGFLLRWLSSGGTSFLTSVDILVTGALLALWIERRATLPTRIAKYADRCIAGGSLLAAVTFVVLAVLHRGMLSGTLIEIAVFGAICWLIQHSGDNHPVTALLRFRPVAYVGSISYMIYLIHLPLYFIVRHIVDARAGSLPETQQMWIVAICSITGQSGIDWTETSEALALPEPADS